MIRPFLVVVLSSLFLARVHGIVEAPIPGYGVDVISWKVETSPGGPIVVLNGTIEEVHAQLLKINPNYDTDFEAIADQREAPQAGPSLIKRDDVHCGYWALADEQVIETGIAYLRRVQGQPVLGPGPSKCGRVSCSYDSGIWWCNDNSFTKTLPSFGNIADGAQEIIDHCPTTFIQRNSPLISGQTFINPPRDWNVIVSYTSNSC